MVVLQPTQEEKNRQRAVVSKVLQFTESNTTIKLPDFDPGVSRPSDHYAMVSVGIEPNDFGGTVGEFRYQFEGEEDLLHLIVTRRDMSPLRPEEAQTVVGFLLPGVSPALIWLKPAEFSQHFFVGHDELVAHLKL